MTRSIPVVAGTLPTGALQNATGFTMYTTEGSGEKTKSTNLVHEHIVLRHRGEDAFDAQGRRFRGGLPQRRHQLGRRVLLICSRRCCIFGGDGGIYIRTSRRAEGLGSAEGGGGVQRERKLPEFMYAKRKPVETLTLGNEQIYGSILCSLPVVRLNSKYNVESYACIPVLMYWNVQIRTPVGQMHSFLCLLHAVL